MPILLLIVNDETYLTVMILLVIALLCLTTADLTHPLDYQLMNMERVSKLLRLPHDTVDHRFILETFFNHPVCMLVPS